MLYTQACKMFEVNFERTIRRRWPVGAPVNASSRTSRCATHDSGTVWFVIPFLFRDFHSLLFVDLPPHYRSIEAICLLRSPFPGSPTCARSRPLVPPMPTGLGFLPLVEPFPALPRVVVPSFCLSRLHLPASLGSTGITPASSLLRRLCHLPGAVLRALPAAMNAVPLRIVI